MYWQPSYNIWFKLHQLTVQLFITCNLTWICIIWLSEDLSKVHVHILVFCRRWNPWINLADKWRRRKASPSHLASLLANLLVSFNVVAVTFVIWSLILTNTYVNFRCAPQTHTFFRYDNWLHLLFVALLSQVQSSQESRSFLWRVEQSWILNQVIISMPYKESTLINFGLSVEWEVPNGLWLHAIWN